MGRGWLSISGIPEVVFYKPEVEITLLFNHLGIEYKKDVVQRAFGNKKLPLVENKILSSYERHVYPNRPLPGLKSITE
jgi:hypothetical protein